MTSIPSAAKVEDAAEETKPKDKFPATTADLVLAASSLQQSLALHNPAQVKVAPSILGTNPPLHV